MLCFKVTNMSTDSMDNRNILPVAVCNRDENEMIIIDLNNEDEGLDVNDHHDAIDVDLNNGSCLCCPLEFIEWNAPYGLLYYNLPCFPKRITAKDWSIDSRNFIRIPDEHKMIPSYLLLIPCVWLHLCMVLPFMEANSILVYIENNHLKLQLHRKGTCSETITQSNNDSYIVTAHIQVRQIHQKEIRLLIILSNGARFVKTQWLKYDVNTNSKLNFLRDTINNYVHNIDNYTINYELASTTPTLATTSNSRSDNHCDGLYCPIVADARIISDDSNSNYIDHNDVEGLQLTHTSSQVMSR